MVAKFFENFDPQGVILGVKGQFLGVLRVKKVKNRGSPIGMKFGPEKYFGAGNSKMTKFLDNFDPQGVIFVVKGQF